MKQQLMLATTVPETFATILKFQPRRLACNFNVSLVTSPGEGFQAVLANEALITHSVAMVRGINVLRDIVSVMRMVALLLRTRPALLHSYTPKAGLVCMLSGWICRVPIRIHTFTGLVFPTSQRTRQKLLIWIDRLICACATHIVPEGEGVANDLRHYHITSKPLQVIGHGNIAGVDTEFFSRAAPGVAVAGHQLLADHSIPSSGFVFCFVGRLNKDKGLDELVAAFATMPPHAHLLLGGALDQTAPVSKATLELIASHPRIHALGFLEDVRSILFAANILILPSYREGFPNVLLQAGAMQLPAIASDINGCNELLEPEHNGWLVPVRDFRALAGAMQTALNTHARNLRTMGENARIRVQERFEQRQHWDRMVIFYKNLLDVKNAKLSDLRY